MKLSAFEKIIRKVVREEIDYALRREITILKEELTNNNQVISEVKNEPAPEEFRQKLREQFTPQAFSQDSTLNGLLDHNGYKTSKTYKNSPN